MKRSGYNLKTSGQTVANLSKYQSGSPVFGSSHEYETPEYEGRVSAIRQGSLMNLHYINIVTSPQFVIIVVIQTMLLRFRLLQDRM